MATKHQTMERTTVVGVFENGSQAQRAVDELHRAGFRDDQIGVISHDGDHGRHRDHDKTTKTDEGNYAAEGAVAGAVTGAGIGAAWAIGIAAGLLPAIGPVIAGGTLAAILASAGLGAAAASLAGALIGMGIPEEEAEYYESEFKAGRTIVTVRNAADRYDEVLTIIRRHGGHAQERRGEFTRATFPSSATGQTSHAHTGQPLRSVMGEGKAVQVREEEMHAHKHQVQTGEVKVHKDVVTEHKKMEVPVEREEVVVERRPASGRAAPGEIKETGEEIRIPVKEEQVRVETTPVVKEEVVVGKKKVHDTKQVEADVKKEQVRVERTGDVDVRDERCP